MAQAWRILYQWQDFKCFQELCPDNRETLCQQSRRLFLVRYTMSNRTPHWSAVHSDRELANDPRFVPVIVSFIHRNWLFFRCSSTLPSSPSCTPQTITKWHAEMAQTIKSYDPNHLISSGYAIHWTNSLSGLIESYRRNQGFFCLDCPKLFPLKGHRSKRREELREFYWQKFRINYSPRARGSRLWSRIRWVFRNR